MGTLRVPKMEHHKRLPEQAILYFQGFWDSIAGLSI